MRKKIIFIYDKTQLSQYNSEQHSGWVRECSEVYDIRFWGRGFGDESLDNLKKTVDNFKPDYIYLTVGKVYFTHAHTGCATWFPNLSEIPVPKIFVECDTAYTPYWEDFYSQFDHIYVRWAWPGFFYDKWGAFPRFRWSVPSLWLEPFKPLPREGIKFVGQFACGGLYLDRLTMKELYGDKIQFIREFNFNSYWEILRSSAMLICPKYSGYGDYVPFKLFEYIASGSAVLTNCDLDDYGLSELHGKVLEFTDLKNLEQYLSVNPVPYQGTGINVLREHTHVKRYSEIFV